MRTRFWLQAAEKRADITARRQQRRRLRLDARHVLIERRFVVMPDGLLTYLAGAYLHDCIGEDRHDLWRLRVGRRLIRLGEVEIADHDGRLIAASGRYCRPAPPHRGALDDVVLHPRP